MTERFSCPAGNVSIEIDDRTHTASVRLWFRGWGSGYQEECVSATADALQRVLKRLEYERDAAPVAEQIQRRIEDLKQVELFAPGGIING